MRVNVRQAGTEPLDFTLCGDEPPLIHDDETLDAEEYQATHLGDDEVAL